MLIDAIKSEIAEVTDKLGDVTYTLQELRKDREKLETRCDELNIDVEVISISDADIEQIEKTLKQIRNEFISFDTQIEDIQYKAMFQKREDALRKLLLEAENKERVERYDQLTVDIYERMLNLNNLINKVNTERKSILDTISQRPSVQTTARHPSGEDWETVFKLLGDPYQADSDF